MFELRILVETSARHIHLSEKDMVVLFGEGADLTMRRELSQPGQFVSFERLDIVGPKGEIKGVSILGPVRSHTQVELSLTDARKIGIAAPVRESGNIEGTPGCELIGPKGKIKLERGVIAAKRHIHLDCKTAEKMDLADRQVVSVKIQSDERTLTFEDVVVRVSEKFSPAMHIDTDECNAAGICGEVYGEIIS